MLRRIDAVAGNEVAITVDDSPTPEATPALLDILSAANMRASFFISGFRAEKHPELVVAIVREGHAVFAHGWDHIRLDREPTQRLIGDMQRCEELLARFRPTPSPYLVRLPYNGGYRNVGVHRSLNRWQPGCQIAHWEISTEDHDTLKPGMSDAALAESAAGKVASALEKLQRPGAIILMHDQPISDIPDGPMKAQASIKVMKGLTDGLALRGLISIALRPQPLPGLLGRFVLG